MTMVIKFGIAVILALLFRIFFAISISLDAKEANAKNRTLYSVLSFFFPLIVGIVYACNRDNKKIVPAEAQIEAPIKKSNASMICFILAVIMLIASSGIAIVTTVVEFTKMSGGMMDTITEDIYDMKGNKISSSAGSGIANMPYYDRDGNIYKYDERINDDDMYEDNSVYIRQSDRAEFDPVYCYLDADGYFIYNEDDIYPSDDFESHTDDKGNIYYDINGMYWDKDGNMKNLYTELYSNSGIEDMIDSFDKYID